MKVGDLIKWLSWDQKQQVGVVVRKQGDAGDDLARIGEFSAQRA